MANEVSKIQLPGNTTMYEIADNYARTKQYETTLTKTNWVSNDAGNGYTYKYVYANTALRCRVSPLVYCADLAKAENFSLIEDAEATEKVGITFFANEIPENCDIIIHDRG